MPEVIDWPGNLEIADRTHPQLIANTRSPGMALNGAEQIISPASAMWRWQIQVPLRNRADLRALSVLLDSLQGRYGYLRINMCDATRLSRGDLGATPTSGSVPHSDGAFFSDGSGYALADGYLSPEAAAAAGASSLSLDLDGFPATSGTPFSINGWLYRIKSIDDPADLDNPGTIRTVNFAPPLRAAVTTADEVRWGCDVIWRLATDEEGQATLRAGKLGTTLLNLVEPIMRDEI